MVQQQSPKLPFFFAGSNPAAPDSPLRDIIFPMNLPVRSCDPYGFLFIKPFL